MQAVIHIGGLDSTPKLTVNLRSYVQGLKRKINDWQRNHQRKRQRIQAPCAQLSPQDLERHATDTEDHLPEDDEPTQESSVHDALAEFSHFGLNASSTAPGQVLGTGPKPLGTWSLVKRVGFFPTVDSATHKENEAILHTMLTPRADSSCPVLTKDKVMTALSDYEDAVLQVHPFVDQGMLRTCCLSVVQNPRSMFDTTGDQDALLACVVLMTSYAKNDADFGSSVAEIWLRAKVAQLCAKAEGSDSISVMRCLTAIALHSFYGNDISAASCLIGLALSKAIALGFHRCTPERRTPLSVEHSAARIFSTLFVLER